MAQQLVLGAQRWAGTPVSLHLHVIDRMGGARAEWKVDRRAWLVAPTGEVILWGPFSGEKLWFAWGIQ